MPYRKSYKPYRRSYGSNKKKWASYLNAASIPSVTVTANTSAFAAVDYVANSTQVATPTPTIIKAKHFKTSVDIHLVADEAIQVIGPIVCYLIYIPQGYTLSTTTPIDHPEWILTWRAIDTSVALASSTGYTHHDRISMSSSLSRNLNSGDTIKLLVISSNVTAGPAFLVKGFSHFSCVVRNN